MKTNKQRANGNKQVEIGAAILAAARLVDVTPVKARFGAFATAQRRYVEAQSQVDAAEAVLRQGQVRLARRDAEQNEAVEGLAGALAGSGQPRGNPFAIFGTVAPSAVKEMQLAAKAKAVHQLVAAVQSRKSGGKAVLHAAELAGEAAQRLDAALVAVDKLQTALGNCRHVRDAVGQTWKVSLAALKLDVRAAAADGASDLYAALFGRTGRVRKKPVTPQPQPAPAPQPDPTPQPNPNPPPDPAPAPVVTVTS